ncbi:MAG: HD domain-containing phosphohydrolase [Steroidobacteraceae bacterium]
MSHILIAYEREAEQVSLEKLLLNRGHSVVRAANGLEALDVARRDAPELIVSDVLLPRMDGIALCRKWKQDERLQSVPFVFYTQRYDDPKYERFALELGAERFLARTVRPEAVLQAIDEVLASAPLRVPVLETPAPDVSAMTRSQALVREQQLRTQLAELEATAKRHALGEAQFRGLFEDNPLPLFIADQASGGFIAVNAAALEFYGYQRSELLALPRSALSAAHAREGDQDVIWHVRKDGRRIPVALASTEIQFAGRAADLICVHDIAAAWQHAHNIEAQLKLQRNLLDTMPGGWCLVDREGHLMDANEVYCRMSGYERDELLNKRLKDLEVEGSSGAGDYETQHRRRDGSIYPVDVRVTALRDAAGTETGARILLIQEPSTRALAAITAQHRAQREANEYAQLSVALVEEHELYAKGSAQRVAHLAFELARETGLSPAQCERVRLAGLLHDVGLMSVPASLLHKPAEFTPAEMALVCSHAEAGAKLLARLPDPRIGEIVHQHHERVNGSGYPRGLSGEAICIEARVLAVADVVEAMCSPRPHRAALGTQVALTEIEGNAGVLYDNKVVAACLRLLREQQFAFAA